MQIIEKRAQAEMSSVEPANFHFLFLRGNVKYLVEPMKHHWPLKRPNTEPSDLHENEHLALVFLEI